MSNRKPKGDLPPIIPDVLPAIDRRAFVKTAGGLFLAAGLSGPAGATPLSASPLARVGSGTTRTGGMRVMVSPVPESSATGGSVTLTPLEGLDRSPSTFAIPRGSAGRVTLRTVGRYRVTYQPPAGYGVAPNQAATRDVEIDAGGGEIRFGIAPSGGACVEGTVASTSGAPVGGGVVELLLGRLTVAHGAVDSSGAFSIGDLKPGNYRVQLQPDHRYSLGEGEDEPKAATLGEGETARLSFVVLPAEWYDDFQSYKDTEDLFARFANEPGGRQLWPSGPFTPCIRELVKLDPTGGPDGTKALRYDFWNRVANPEGKGVVKVLPTCARPSPCESFAIYLGRAFMRGAAVSDQWWVRFLSKEGEPPNYFSIGVGSCRESINYKFFLWEWDNIPRYDLILTATARDLNPKTGNALDWATAVQSPGYGRRRYELGNASDWAGRWHTYVYGVDARGGWSDVHLQLYRDGKLLFEENHVPWGDPGGIRGLKLGANMNAGPDQDQHRWFREIGLYRSRPSLRPGVE